jgi:dolichyl-phosphate beta-glucosyltransferase
MADLISIIIPAYNEADRIGKSLEKAMEYLEEEGYNFELIIVDDGSSDNTATVASNYGSRVKVLVQPRNLGKGAAVKRGMLEADGKIRVFSDADFSTPIYELNKLIQKINGGADICIGSRALDPEMIKEHQPFYREFMGKTFNKFVQLLFFRGIKDTQCGFKGFTADAANLIFSQSKINGFSFDVEILFLATKEGLTIEQVPVEWFNDTRSKVDPIKDSLKMLIELVKIKNIHRYNSNK